MRKDPVSGRTVDMKGRLCNATGYLIDEHGNIVKYTPEHDTKVVFQFWEILFQEPPKIFDFTEFDINWIKGRMERDVTLNPRHDDEFDLDGRPINSMGYLVDLAGNIVDQHERQVFKKEILTKAFGQEARIPPVFLKKGLLLKPLSHEDGVSPASESNRIIADGDQKVGREPTDFEGKTGKSGYLGPGGQDETNVGTNTHLELSKSGNMSGVFSSETGGLNRANTNESFVAQKIEPKDGARGYNRGKSFLQLSQNTSEPAESPLDDK